MNQICNGLVGCILVCHAGDRGSIPGWETDKYFIVFLLKPQTLRAKIPPFPRKNMEKNLTGWSLGTICLFKQKKIMVGHFEVGQYFHGRARDSVKWVWQPFKMMPRPILFQFLTYLH